MVTKAFGKRGQWTNCKHLYFIFIVIYGLDLDVDDFIHVPSFSFNEVKYVLVNRILIHQITLGFFVIGAFEGVAIHVH
jgi:hypothetical protein